MGVAMLHVPTPSQTEFARRSRQFHESISARAAKIAPAVKAPYVPREQAINPIPYWRDMWFYDLVRFGERYTPGAPTPNILQIRQIQQAVAEYYGVKVADILSARRTAEVVRPRMIAVFLSKVLTGKSLPEIGRRFGGRDHTTVLNSVRKITRLMETEVGLRSQLDGLAASLGGRLA